MRAAQLAVGSNRFAFICSYFYRAFTHVVLYFQYFVLSSHGEILWESENCVDNSKYEPGGSVELIPCHGMEGNQKWAHDSKSVSIFYRGCSKAKFWVNLNSSNFSRWFIVYLKMGIITTSVNYFRELTKFVKR